MSLSIRRRPRGLRGTRCSVDYVLPRLCLPLLLWSFTLPGWAAAPSISLDEAVHRAVERAPAIDARHAQTTAAEEEARRAAALPDPKLTVGIQDLPVTGSGAFNPGTSDFTMKKVGVMQEFPARAKRDARQALADRTVDQSTALTTAEALTVKRSAAEAWIAVWSAQHEVETLQTLRDASMLAERTAKARLSGGTASAVDVLAAQAAILDLDNRLDAARAKIESAHAMLARWVGEDAEAAEHTAPEFGTLPISADALSQSLDRQGPLLAWQAREQIATAQVNLARAEKHPDWSIGVSYGQRDHFSDLVSVEFSIDLPLFAGNRQDRGVAARQADYEATLDAHEDARRVQRQQVQSDLAQWNSLKRQVARDEEQLLPLAHDRSRVALAAYRGGGALQPWLDARRAEIEEEVTHARMSGDLGRAWAALAYLLPEERTP
ncbi:MAG TPA: TolC family protein [Xanthomonadaceae bacterium]|nr:TolC family protein [Xanthomonadaceae bacterium]